MAPTSTPGDRIERLLKVAAHPSTGFYEATTALEGARKIMITHNLSGLYGLRIIGIGIQLHSQSFGRSMGQFSKSVEAAIREFKRIEDME